MLDGKEYESYICDDNWLRQYHARAIRLLPGDFLDAVYQEYHVLGADGGIVKTKMRIMIIHDVRGPQSVHGRTTAWVFSG